MSYLIKDIYQGGYSSLKPEYGDVFTGYRATINSLGVSTDPRTANVLNELNTKLNPGQKTVELSLIQPNVFESVPDQHLEEVNRMSKLTGVDVTVHGPLIEASGVTRQGFSESFRQNAERQMALSLERTNLVNPNGGSPVTFHSTVETPTNEIQIEQGKPVVKTLAFINKDTGQVQSVPLDAQYSPQEPNLLDKGGYVRSPEEQLDSINRNQWTDSIQGLAINKDRVDDILAQTYPIAQEQWIKLRTGQITEKDLTAQQLEILNRVHNASDILSDIQQNASSLFQRAWKNVSTEDEKKKLRELSDEYAKLVRSPQGVDLKIQSQAVQKLLNGLSEVSPKQFEFLDKFANEKAAETFGNVAFHGYQKFKDKAPIVSIENPPAGGGLATGDDLKRLVESSREQFVKAAVKEGLKEKEAKKQAEKLIGVTWDVGHINMLRKFGYSEKDVVKQSEMIKPYLKHVHLSDNFGMDHTELPMGMGNVPLKDIMDRLGEKGFEAKKIVEAGNWWQHFQTSPIQASLAGLGAPIYGNASMATGPYWNQAIGLQQDYLGGYGRMLPSGNYETFGAGFSQLPMELGGVRQGAQGSRMSGRRME